MESKTNGTTILESERLTSLSRRFTEWKLAQEIVKEELAEGDIIVKDGSLQSNFKNEAKYANQLYQLHSLAYSDFFFLYLLYHQELNLVQS